MAPETSRTRDRAIPKYAAIAPTIAAFALPFSGTTDTTTAYRPSPIFFTYPLFARVLAMTIIFIYFNDGDDKTDKKWYDYLIMKTERLKVFVAMSGGVDSSVAAALLKERGFDVVGVHIKMWSDPSIPCNFKEDRYDAMAAAEKIGIPFQTWDFTEEYRTAVVEYLIREYAAGRTPNPDVMCNRHVKFGAFLRRARELGADYMATGHYTRIKNLGSRIKVLQAADRNKDQSYFLWTLTQEQLAYCLFPIGEYTKPEVRQMARRLALPTAEKKDSQGICFIGEIDLNAFLKKHIPVRPGRVLTSSGKEVGGHEGLAFYTMGQREGLGIGGGRIPYYVAAKDFRTNTLVVAEGPYDEKLFSSEIAVSDVHWISAVPLKFPLRCETRIRYRQPLQSCKIARIDADLNADKRRLNPRESTLQSARIRVIFNENQRAATPGQSAVFYRGEEMLGGGIMV